MLTFVTAESLGETEIQTKNEQRKEFLKQGTSILKKRVEKEAEKIDGLDTDREFIETKTKEILSRFFDAFCLKQKEEKNVLIYNEETQCYFRLNYLEEGKSELLDLFSKNVEKIEEEESLGLTYSFKKAEIESSTVLFVGKPKKKKEVFCCWVVLNDEAVCINSIPIKEAFDQALNQKSDINLMDKEGKKEPEQKEALIEEVDSFVEMKGAEINQMKEEFKQRVTPTIELLVTKKSKKDYGV